MTVQCTRFGGTYTKTGQRRLAWLLRKDDTQDREAFHIFWDRGGTVVKVLCYKSEGRWFDPSWCQRIFL